MNRADAVTIFGPGRIVFLISPQPWKGFWVSKHHYAVELAARGCRVFFINPNRFSLAERGLSVEESGIPGLTVVTYRPWFPYGTRRLSRWLFDGLMRRQAAKIRRAIGVVPDIVWDFDNVWRFADLSIFGEALRVHHLVDDVSATRVGDKQADVTLVLHPQFADHLGLDPEDVQLIGHGLGKLYAAAARRVLDAGLDRPSEGRPQVGYVGDLAARRVDWPVLLAAAVRNPDADFIFVGPLPAMGDMPAPLAQLIARDNCHFLGLKSAEEIIALSASIDVWLLCNDARHVLGGPINSHKVLEYLATGRAVLSSWLEAYQDSDLVTLAPRAGNQPIPEMLAAMLANLGVHNAAPKVQARARFALAHGYGAHVDAIAGILAKHPKAARLSPAVNG